MKKSADRLRVLQIGKFYPPFMGGIETHLQNLCGELREHVDLEVLVANIDRETSSEIVDGIPVCRAGRITTLASSPICTGMTKRIRESRADVVHIHLPNPIGLVSYLLSGHRGKLILTYHSDTVKQAVLTKLFQPILNLALRRADRIIATSDNYVRSSKVLGGWLDRCEVIPYGIPLDTFRVRDHAAVAEIRRRYGSRLVVSVGRLVYYKGFEYLVDAMSKIDGNLLIIGEGPLREKLQTMARERGIEDRTFFLGGLDNRFLAPFYHAADIFALPSIARSEAFGIVQIEAMAAGKPVVNTSLDSGVPGVSLHGVTGLTVPPMDSSALATALKTLLDDNSLRSRLGAAARMRAQSEFSVEQMGLRTLDLYEQVAERPIREPALRRSMGAMVAGA